MSGGTLSVTASIAADHGAIASLDAPLFPRVCELAMTVMPVVYEADPAATKTTAVLNAYRQCFGLNVPSAPATLRQAEYDWGTILRVATTPSLPPLSQALWTLPVPWPGAPNAARTPGYEGYVPAEVVAAVLGRRAEMGVEPYPPLEEDEKRDVAAVREAIRG
ncbi:hypothetical protein PAPYR_11331 [Paratrimastix pyriformis]|uniref:Uncharacterized protein n=1 Tax=Paratrimastix pyriformis TaxID=342808 RepID=A0ABQ8U5R7_9EUKA|nr:hypothetical protein PAPYR_11331 [Paratrimastix pyriformis]